MCRESEVVGSAIRGGGLAIELQARRRARCVCRGRARSRRVGRLAAHRVANESDRTWEACGVPWLEASAKRTSDSMGWYNLSLASKKLVTKMMYLYQPFRITINFFDASESGHAIHRVYDSQA